MAPFRREGRRNVRTYLKLMRVHHYIKNLLIFAALVCSGQLFDLRKLGCGLLGFGAFCLASSAVYIFNDVQDVQKDRLHPVKCRRPIAAGLVSGKMALVLAAVLLVLAILCSVLYFSAAASGLLGAYVLLNLGYSLGWKDIPLVDVTILVSGFLLRILYGARITGVAVSDWLYLTVIAVSFYFALGKRRNELKRMEETGTRRVLKFYPACFLDKGMTMCLTMANVFYALWSMDEGTMAAYRNRKLVFTVPIVLLITLKYSLTAEGDSDGDPVEVLLGDKVLLVLCLIYFAAMFLILYF